MLVWLLLLPTWTPWPCSMPISKSGSLFDESIRYFCALTCAAGREGDRLAPARSFTCDCRSITTWLISKNVRLCSEISDLLALNGPRGLNNELTLRVLLRMHQLEQFLCTFKNLRILVCFCVL